MSQNAETQELLKTQLAELIPEALLRAARNPEKLDVMPLRQNDGELSFIVVEHGYGGQTDEKEWSEWLNAIERAPTEAANPRAVYLPKETSGIDRMHAKFRTDIESGRFALSDRILLSCVLRMYSGPEAVLYVKDYDGEKGLGVAMEFYTQILPKLAKKLGIKFIAGDNNPGNIAFFTDKVGRYMYKQLKPEAKQKLFPDIPMLGSKAKDMTIQFVNPEDAEKYVLESEIKSKV